MSYRVRQDGETVDELRARDTWYVLTPDRLRAEAAEHGLTTTLTDETQGMLVIGR